MARIIKYEVDNVKDWTPWVQPVPKNYRMACCDCGLVHNLEFRIHKGRIQFRVQRNQRSTGQLRRHMRKEGKIL
jgi:hypothetical protein